MQLISSFAPVKTTVAIILLVLSGFLYFLRSTISLLYYGDSYFGFYVSFIAAGPFLVGLGLFIFLYLNGDIIFPFLKEISFPGMSLKLADSSAFDIKQIKELQERMSEIRAKVEEGSAAMTQLPPGQTDALVERLKLKLEGVAAADLIRQIESKYAAQIAQDSQISQIRSSLQSTKQRLADEIASLSRRNILNLTIGAVTTALAVGMLAYLVLGVSQQTFDNIPDLLAHFIPRVSVAAFIEVFSFFFLKLYKSGLQEIKYFQNELTNVDMKSIALEAAFLKTPNKLTEKIAPELVATDRNVVTSSKITGEDGNQIDAKSLVDLLDKFGKLIGSGKS